MTQPITWKNINPVSGSGALTAAIQSGQNIGGGVNGIANAFSNYGDRKKQEETDLAVSALRAAAPEDRHKLLQSFAESNISMDSKQIGDAASRLDKEQMLANQFMYQKEKDVTSNEHWDKTFAEDKRNTSINNRINIAEFNQKANRNALYGGSGTTMDSEGRLIGAAKSVPGEPTKDLNALYSGARTPSEKNFVADRFTQDISSSIRPISNNSGDELLRFRDDVFKETSHISSPLLRKAVQNRLLPNEVVSALDPKKARESVRVGEASREYATLAEYKAGLDSAINRTRGIVSKGDVNSIMYENNRDTVINGAIAMIPEDVLSGINSALDMEIYDADNYSLNAVSGTPEKFTATELKNNIDRINKGLKVAENSVNTIIKSNLAGIPANERSAFRKEVLDRSGITEIREKKKLLNEARVSIRKGASTRAVTKAESNIAKETKFANDNTKRKLYDAFGNVSNSKIDMVHKALSEERPSVPDWVISKIMIENLSGDRDWIGPNDLEIKNKNALFDTTDDLGTIDKLSEAVDEFLRNNQGVVKGVNRSVGERALYDATVKMSPYL